eukprot:9306329-Pyramimonas_sp.AAC.1
MAAMMMVVMMMVMVVLIMLMTMVIVMVTVMVVMMAMLVMLRQTATRKANFDFRGQLRTALHHEMQPPRREPR